ncbi:hypothetical protein ACFE04_002954 [Oxalis oulophora]
MACGSQAMVSTNMLTTTVRMFNVGKMVVMNKPIFSVRASSSVDDPDCNDAECAPDKEVEPNGNERDTYWIWCSAADCNWWKMLVFVFDDDYLEERLALKIHDGVGKISMEWVAEEKTKVVGTFPPRNRGRGWTGYVEKDTAGQTNIYSVEPVVYVAENAISSGTAGSSSDGSENTLAISVFLALICIAGASSVLLQVDKKSPTVVQTAEYSGPSLSYYISKFKPIETIQAEVPSQTETAPPVLEETTAPALLGSESPQSEIQPEPNTSNDS